jgi:prepilin signal peptidase PulO-like enzyme (type II secretory pathway)
MFHVLFAVAGLLLGGVINWLADYLPAWRQEEAAPKPFPRRGLDFLALFRALRRQADVPRRHLAVEVGTMLLFALLPALIQERAVLLVHALYIAVLILVIVIDIEHHLVLHVVTFPTTAVALLLSFFLPDTGWKLALVGAVVGFLLFYLFFWVGKLLFGEGALGFGDVTLAMTIGAMLGFHRVVFALILAVFLGGVFSLLLLLLRVRGRKSYVAYGPYLALAAIFMLIWGTQVYQSYVG